MTALRNLNLMYNVAGFIDANKYTPFELIEAGIMNYSNPLNNYSDYLRDATGIYKRARLSDEGISLDYVYIESARGLLLAMKYKPFNAVKLITYVHERFEAQISYPAVSSFNKDKFIQSLGIP